MDEIKFAHMADTHLGARNFKLRERENDFYRAFEDSIDKIIKKNIDFVVHSGDLFEKASPSISSILVAIENLRKLRENDIEVFMIPGNHDIYLNETFLSVLESLGLIRNLGSKRYFRVEGNSIICFGEIFRNVFLVGIPGRRSRIKEIYQKLFIKFPEGSKFKIFIFHHITDSVTPRFFDIHSDLLPRGFDYYAGGHWHSRFEDDLKKIYYPGSTEFWDVSEMKRDREKGFFIVKLFEGGNEKEWIKTNVREIKISEMNCNNLSVFDVNTKILDEIRRNPGSGEIMILKLFGRLREGNRNRISRGSIEEMGRKLGYLYIYIDDTQLLNPEERFVEEVREKKLEDIEREYLEEKFDKREIELARMLIETLGRDIKPLEMASIKKKLVEEIKKVFGLGEEA